MLTREYGADWTAEQDDPHRVPDQAVENPDWIKQAATDPRGLRVEFRGVFYRWPLPLRSRQIDRINRGLVTVADDQGGLK